MSKSKHAPALFELIDSRSTRKGSDKLAVPKWFKRSETQPAPPEESTGTDPTSESTASAPAVRSSAAGTGAPFHSVARSAEHTTGQADRTPVFQLENGRLVLSLNPINASIAGGIILLVILSSFLIGQSTGSGGGDIQAPAAVDDIQQALKKPAKPDLLKVGGNPPPDSRSGSTKDQPAQTAGQTQEKPTPRPERSAGPPEREPGINYVVIESFKQEHKKSAEHVKQWLQENYGLETTLERSGDYWRLVTVLGFDYREAGQKEACQKFLDDLKALGDTCARELSGKGLAVYRLSGPFAQNFGK